MNRKEEPHPTCGQACGAISSPPVATPEERLAKIEEMIAAIYERICPDRDGGIGPVSYQRAIREFAKGNKKPLELFLKRGGKIPSINR